MPKAEPFEKNVEKYEEWFERNRLDYEREIEALSELHSYRGQGLEVGVGTGRFSVPLKVQYGIDPSYAMGRLAKKRGADFVLGVGENLPYKDNVFDYVVFVTVLCFADDVSASLAEAYRSLKPGGYILVGHINRKSPLGRVYEERKPTSVFYRHATFLSVDEVVLKLVNAGFGNLEFRQTIFKNAGTPQEPKSVKRGFNEGAFVVVRGIKPKE